MTTGVIKRMMKLSCSTFITFQDQETFYKSRVRDPEKEPKETLDYGTRWLAHNKALFVSWALFLHQILREAYPRITSIKRIWARHLLPTPIFLSSVKGTWGPCSKFNLSTWSWTCIFVFPEYATWMWILRFVLYVSFFLSYFITKF